MEIVIVLLALVVVATVGAAAQSFRSDSRENQAEWPQR